MVDRGALRTRSLVGGEIRRTLQASLPARAHAFEPRAAHFECGGTPQPVAACLGRLVPGHACCSLRLQATQGDPDGLAAPDPTEQEHR
jgi:hypothetical protein